MLGGVPKSVGSKILNGKQTPSFKQFLAMERMFDTPVNQLMKMRCYEEACEGGDGDFLGVPKKQQRLIDLYKKVPVGEMISNHWVGVHDRNDPDEMLRAFEPFVSDSEKHGGLAHKSHSDDVVWSNLQRAWWLHVRTLGKDMKTSGSYSASNVEQAILRLKDVMINDGKPIEAVRILDQVGIRMVFVECKNSCIDAVCTWLDEQTPVIGMTLRFDRIDNFWFVLRHELAHVQQGYADCLPVDCDLGKKAIHKLEDEANAIAQEFCAPAKLVERFLLGCNGRITESTVAKYAKENKINPAVLAGQIRHRLARYNILNKMLTKYREELLLTAPKKDGWGYVAA